MRQRFLERFKARQFPISPGLFPRSNPILETPIVFAADFVADHVAGEGVKTRGTNAAERFAPLLPTCGNVIVVAENGSRNVWRDVAKSARRGRAALATRADRQFAAHHSHVQPLLDFHRDLLAWKFIKSRLGKRRDIGISGLASKLHGERSGGVSTICEETGSGAGREKFASFHGLAAFDRNRAVTGRERLAHLDRFFRGAPMGLLPSQVDEESPYRSRAVTVRERLAHFDTFFRGAPMGLLPSQVDEESRPYRNRAVTGRERLAHLDTFFWGAEAYP